MQLHPFWGKLPDSLEMLLKNLIELLAAIPSVVYGLWGIFVISPLHAARVCNWLHKNLGWIPFFDTSYNPYGMLPAALVLAIMVLPTISAISRDALVSVPPKLREAAYGLGATRWEALSRRDHADGADRHLRLHPAGLRPGPGRNDGPGHAGGQRQYAELVAVLAGQHAGGPAGQHTSPRRGNPTSSPP